MSRFISDRKTLAITAFVEALHSCFKNGLNGTRDYRALAGAPLFVSLLFDAVTYFFTHNFSPGVRENVAMALWTIVVCIVSYVRPCKSAVANLPLIFHITLIGILICVTYLWEFEDSIDTYTLEVTFVAILVLPHNLVVVWAGYTLTKQTLARF